MQRCQELRQSFVSRYWGGDNSVLQSGGAQTVSSLMFGVPVLLGAFAGAPLLSRELESGTFRFAWTQGAGRIRWVLSTLLVPALVLTAATGAFTAIFYWYLRPFLALGQVSEMLPLTFALIGVALAAWTLLAYALAAFLGALLRRTVPAMVITLVVYIAAAMQTATAIRPHYAAPVTVPSASAAANSGWVISQFTKSAAGQEISQNDLNVPASVQNSSKPRHVPGLADAVRLHAVDHRAAGHAVLGVPANRGRMARRRKCAPDRRLRVAHPPPGRLRKGRS